MEDEWTGKNVDLALLTEQIVQFFKQKRIATLSEKAEDELLITANPDPGYGIVEVVKVHISGRPEHFKVRFDSGSRSNSFVRYGTLTQLLGGGVFALKGLKSQEALEKLEREFWVCVDNAVWNLARDFSRSKG